MMSTTCDLMVGVWEIKSLAPFEPRLNLGGMLIPEPLAVVFVAKIEPPFEFVIFLVGVRGCCMPILPLSILTFKFKFSSDFKFKFFPPFLSPDTTFS